MSSAPSTADIAKDAKWLAQALDPTADVVRFIAMNREAYCTASFLDDRMLQQTVDAHIVPWLGVKAAMLDELRHDARWIFHIGHVGSTLVSRLLGEIKGVLAVREPRLLRDIALSPPDIRSGYIGAIPKLMSRTFAADETACIKATSLVSEIAPELVPPDERALFMFASPGNYIAGILAGENSIQELRLLGESRLERMAKRVGILAVRNDAELAAAAWACEITSLEAAAEAMPDRRIAWADFDQMLAKVPAELSRIAAFFGFSADNMKVDTIARGPLMTRYSKAPEYEYSPALRSDLIAEVCGTQGREIDDALALLTRAAEKSPLLARALERAGEA